MTRMAMLRALEIHFGSAPLVDFDSTEKETITALKEIALGKIIFKDGVREDDEAGKKFIVEMTIRDEASVNKIESVTDEIKDDTNSIYCSNG